MGNQIDKCATDLCGRESQGLKQMKEGCSRIGDVNSVQRLVVDRGTISITTNSIYRIWQGWVELMRWIAGMDEMLTLLKRDESNKKRLGFFSMFQGNIELKVEVEEILESPLTRK